jgi:glycosyltransferase involved in cell wall biosynthesis
MQSLVTLESIACGTPVITSDAFFNAAKSMVIENECGSVYDYQSPKALAEVIINFAENKILYENIITNCLKARVKYSFKMISEKWLELMIKLTDQYSEI